MNPICFYHRADFDGVCSAAIVKKFVPDCELYGIDYNDPFPWQKVAPTFVTRVDGNDPRDIETQFAENGELVFPGNSGTERKVYMVDFSLKPDEMKRLSEVTDLVWCDHHKSALESCVGLDIRGVRSTALAGCELAWEWFASRDGEGMMLPPEAVRLLGRYDVWDAKNPDWSRIEAFQFGMRAKLGMMNPEDPNWWTLLSGECVESILRSELVRTISTGRAILSYHDQEAKALCADGCHEEILWLPAGAKGIPVPGLEGVREERWALICLNTLQRGSWQFNSVWDPEKHDAMCVYGQLKDRRWRVSLYSTKEEVDCGAIAKAFGGGGHKGAAGFVCDKLPWEK